MMNVPNFKKFGSFQQASRFFDDSSSSSTYEDGVALVESANYSAALRFLDDVIAFNPMDYQAWTLRGVALVYLERYEDAIASCDRALVYQPNHSKAWKFRGLALHGLNRYREASASYERALGIVRHSPMQTMCEWLRHKLGRADNTDYQALML